MVVADADNSKNVRSVADDDKVDQSICDVLVSHFASDYGGAGDESGMSTTSRRT